MEAWASCQEVETPFLTTDIHMNIMGIHTKTTDIRMNSMDTHMGTMDIRMSSTAIPTVRRTFMTIWKERWRILTKTLSQTHCWPWASKKWPMEVLETAVARTKMTKSMRSARRTSNDSRVTKRSRIMTRTLQTSSLQLEMHFVSFFNNLAKTRVSLAWTWTKTDPRSPWNTRRNHHFAQWLTTQMMKMTKSWRPIKQEKKPPMPALKMEMMPKMKTRLIVMKKMTRVRIRMKTRTMVFVIQRKSSSQ
mmetsp:Transcript_10324/g.20302  ORF Transcript_10324/g.20302 Transcript_10324/m.20302 type:complete len:247 (+) Transcript_10324:327-1067(+)